MAEHTAVKNRPFNDPVFSVFFFPSGFESLGTNFLHHLAGGHAVVLLPKLWQTQWHGGALWSPAKPIATVQNDKHDFTLHICHILLLHFLPGATSESYRIILLENLAASLN